MSAGQSRSVPSRYQAETSPLDRSSTSSAFETVWFSIWMYQEFNMSLTPLQAALPNPSFGECLFRYRIRAGLSQVGLARSSGISVRALRELEHGRAAAAQRRSAELLAEALGLTGDEWESFVLMAKHGRRRSSRSDSRATLHTLPTTPGLVGREFELDRLFREVETGGVVVVAGPPGVGKTTLAVAAAERLATRLPGEAASRWTCVVSTIGRFLSALRWNGC